MHPGILPDASFRDCPRRGAAIPERCSGFGATLAGAIGQHQVVKIVLELDALFLHVFEREIIDRHIVLFQIFDPAGQAGDRVAYNRANSGFSPAAL